MASDEGGDGDDNNGDDEEAFALPFGVLRNVLERLSIREGTIASGTCRAWRGTWRSIEESSSYRGRLIVGASKETKGGQLHSRIFEVDPLTCRVLSCTEGHLPFSRKRGRQKSWSRRPSSRGPSRHMWITSMAFAPPWWPDRDLYVCQYKADAAGRHAGILQFRGRDLTFRSVFFKGAELADPEGMAFASGMLFSCSAANCTVVSLSPQAQVLQEVDLGDRVPWALAASPPGTPPAVFVSVESSYPQDDYYLGPRFSSGAVLRVPLSDATDSKGAMGTPEVFAGGDGTLRRPGGLCFDPRGNLLVTSLDGRVHMYGGGATMSTIRAVPLGVYAVTDEDPMLSGRMSSFGRPWDVALVEGRVCVTAHSSRWRQSTATSSTAAAGGGGGAPEAMSSAASASDAPVEEITAANDDNDGDEQRRGLHGVVFLREFGESSFLSGHPEVLGTAVDPVNMWMPNMMCTE